MADIAREHGMTVIVKTVTRLTLAFILLYGIYIALNGHISPGGGFVGGVIVALSFVHVMLAFGKEAALKRLHSKGLRLAVNIGALMFLYIVMMRFAWKFPAGRFIIEKMRPHEIFANEIILPLCELAIVGAGLFTVFIALVLLCKYEEKIEKEK
jgi:multicomponent Na+:H+ antiporter subunit B